MIFITMIVKVTIFKLQNDLKELRVNVDTRGGHLRVNLHIFRYVFNKGAY